MKELTASSEIVLKKKLTSRISQGDSGVHTGVSHLQSLKKLLLLQRHETTAQLWFVSNMLHENSGVNERY